MNNKSNEEKIELRAMTCVCRVYRVNLWKKSMFRVDRTSIIASDNMSKEDVTFVRDSSIVKERISHPVGWTAAVVVVHVVHDRAINRRPIRRHVTHVHESKLGSQVFLQPAVRRSYTDRRNPSRGKGARWDSRENERWCARQRESRRAVRRRDILLIFISLSFFFFIATGSVWKILRRLSIITGLLSRSALLLEMKSIFRTTSCFGMLAELFVNHYGKQWGIDAI